MSKRTRQLRDEISDMNWQLEESSERALRKMMEYLRLKNVSTYQRLMVQRDLTQSVLEAQAQGRTLDDVIGRDFHEFCDSIIAELPQPTAQERRLRMLRDGVGGLALLWFLACLVPLLSGYLAYSSRPALWQALRELGYISTDMPVTPMHLILLLVGTIFVARLSVSDKSKQADRLFQPRRKMMYAILMCGALVFFNWLNGRGLIPISGFLTHTLVVLPLGVNVVVQVVFVGAFLLLNERTD